MEKKIKKDRKETFDLLFEEIMQECGGGDGTPAPRGTPAPGQDEDVQEGTQVDEGFFRWAKQKFTPRLSEKTKNQANDAEFNKELAAAMATNDAHLVQGKQWTYEKVVHNEQGDERTIIISVRGPQKARSMGKPMVIKVKVSTDQSFNKENIEKISTSWTEDELAKVIKTRCDQLLPGFSSEIENAKEKKKREKGEADAAAAQSEEDDLANGED